MRAWLVGAGLIALAGCEAQPCVRQSDCRSGLICQVGVCTAPPVDAGPEVGDAGIDASELPDAPRTDVLDAPPADAGDTPPEADAGMLDAGSIDAGLIDAGPIDAGPIDAGPIDAGAVDAPDAPGLDAP